MRIKQIVQKKDWVYIILTVLLGSLNHFLYEWTGRNPFTALITPVNESTWEHLKLLFFPFLLFTVLEYYISRPRRSSFFTARLAGVLLGMLSIVLLFYGYTAVLGTHNLIIDILIFIIGVMVSYVVSGCPSQVKGRPSGCVPCLVLCGSSILYFYLLSA